MRYLLFLAPQFPRRYRSRIEEWRVVEATLRLFTPESLPPHEMTIAEADELFELMRETFEEGGDASDL